MWHSVYFLLHRRKHISCLKQHRMNFRNIKAPSVCEIFLTIKATNHARLPTYYSILNYC